MSNILGQTGLTLDAAIWLAMTEQAGDDLIYIRKFAKSAALTNNVEEDIWDVGGTQTLLTSAVTLSVVSSDAADDVAGTGARYIQINGLDANYDLQSEVVTMDGITPVVTTNSFLRVHSARVVGAGSSESNTGNITITSTGPVTRAYIQATRCTTRMSHFTVPDGYTGIVVDTNFSVYRTSGASGAKSCEIDIHARVPIPVLGGFVEYQTNQYGVRSDGSSVATFTPRLPGLLPPKTDFKYRATPDGTGTVASVQYAILLVKGTFMDNVTII